MASVKLKQAVEAYFTNLRLVCGSGGVTDERSLYVPLANLLNAGESIFHRLAQQWG